MIVRRMGRRGLRGFAVTGPGPPRRAPNATDAGIKTVVEKMKSDRTKHRVTFYYLLAEATGTLGKLV